MTVFLCLKNRNSSNCLNQRLGPVRIARFGMLVVVRPLSLAMGVVVRPLGLAMGVVVDHPLLGNRGVLTLVSRKMVRSGAHKGDDDLGPVTDRTGWVEGHVVIASSRGVRGRLSTLDIPSTPVLFGPVFHPATSYTV
ncbi:hypothetical protein M9H77_17654 [Catharanthus roseus]|uniref:Uncharacterized protein n=1 Tax=Catharanthus roseus TaxID=4058 RepID=A0ACC0B575_CATRO|nr:hypothetical protein M9H77_17654 [Catharanthus roseus]